MAPEKLSKDVILTEQDIIKGVKRGLGRLYLDDGRHRFKHGHNPPWVFDYDKRTAVLRKLDNKPDVSESELVVGTGLNIRFISDSCSTLTGRVYTKGGREILHRLLKAIDEREAMSSKNEG